MHPSDSIVQQNAEKEILRKLEKQIGLCENALVETKVFLKDRTYVNFDGFNKEQGIIVEVYARIGKLGKENCYRCYEDDSYGESFT